MRAYRQQGTSSLSYWSIVKAGIVVSLIVGAMVGLMEMLYVALTPEFFDGYANAYIESMRARGASATEIADFKSTMESFSWMRNPLMTGIFYLAQTAVLGVVMSFIVGMFMRPKPQPKLA